MAGFNDSRIKLLGLIVLICGILIMAGGPKWGIDITGGSEIMLKVRTSQVTLGFDLATTEDDINDLIESIEDNLNTRVISLNSVEEIQRSRQMLLEIGKPVTEELINPLLDSHTFIADGPVEAVSDATREDVKNILDMRVNLLGTKNTQFKSIGANFILFEVAESLEEARELLGHQGYLEVFIENEQALRGEHLQEVGSVRYETSTGQYMVPFSLTETGAQSFAETANGMGGYPGVIYLDRPDDSVLLFTPDFISSLNTDEDRPDPEYGIVGDFEYDEEARMFYVMLSSNDHSFYLRVPAVEIGVNSIPAESLAYLDNQVGTKNRVIYLGHLDDLNENLLNGDNLLLENGNQIPIENRAKGEELTTGWLLRVAGVRSWPTISEDIATGDVDQARRLQISTGTEESASNLRVILSQRLPVEVTTESEREMDARLGEQFLEEAAVAALIAFLAVAGLVYTRYRRLKIVVPLMMTMVCEVIIILGIASSVPFITFGLAEIGGLIAVVGTGVDHQIIISDEVLAGASAAGRAPVNRRVGRAFTVIFAAAATTIAAMVMLATLGFGTMRGFALITMMGVLVSVLITRPAYARIIGVLIGRETQKQK